LLNLTALAAVSLSGATGEGELPTRLVVAPWGEHDARKRGLVRVNQRTLDGFNAAQSSLRLDRVAIDFEHNTVPGTPAHEASTEPRKVAGYGTPVVLSNVGIVLENIEWTPEGKAALEGGHYQDLSPTAFRAEDGTVLGLHSVALCRHGELEGLTIESAKAAAALLPLFTALSAEISPSTSTPALNSDMKEALLKLLAALGLTVTPEMDDDAVTALMADYADKAGAKKEEAKPDAMGAELATVRAELDAVRKERVIDAARIEGKIIPLSAEAIKLTPLSVLEELVRAAKPGEVPLKKAGEKAAPGLNDETPADAFTAEEKEVFAKFGLTPEAVAKSLNLETAKTAA
jgi:phage I-like protein